MDTHMRMHAHMQTSTIMHILVFIYLFLHTLYDETFSKRNARKEFLLFDFVLFERVIFVVVVGGI